MQIFAVVVRYRVALSDSQTIDSLSRAFSQYPEAMNSVRVLIWDNSPIALEHPELSFPFNYDHGGQNVGMSGAFNSAAEQAQQENIPWLLLLDQDTVLPPYFFSKILEYVRALTERPEVAAIVPTVLVGDFVVSPRRMLLNRHKAYPKGEIGLAKGEAAAVNSGTLLRVSTLLAIGGFSLDFWLDYSDWYVFHQLHLRGMRVWRAADITLQHSMTVMDYDNLMSLERYKNLLAAEGAFNDLYKGRLENTVQTLRLAVRVLKQRLKFKNPEFSRLTWRYLIARVFSSRTTKIRRWQQYNSERRLK
jgi:GT2 family glycosyltransferase